MLCYRSLQVILTNLEGSSSRPRHLGLFGDVVAAEYLKEKPNKPEVDRDSAVTATTTTEKAPVVMDVGVRVGRKDDEGSDEGFIDSMDSRTAFDEDEEMKGVVLDVTRDDVVMVTANEEQNDGAEEKEQPLVDSLKSLLAFCFYDDPVHPALITLCKNDSLPSLCSL
jgi:hypothetical protein